MQVSHGDKGNEYRWKKCQGREGPHGTNFARSGTCEGRENKISSRVTRELTGGT